MIFTFASVSNQLKAFFEIVWTKITSRKRWMIILSVSLLLFIFISFALIYWSAPNNFPKNFTIEIKKGMTLREVSNALREHNIIQSPFWFTVGMKMRKGNGTVVAGDYYFNEPQSLRVITSRFTLGSYGLTPFKVTIPEGWSTIQIGDLLSSKFSLFEKDVFLSKHNQGYLFPDTYFFFPNITAEQVIERMRDNFDTKTLDLKKDADLNKKNWNDVVTMASILEEEGKTFEDRKLISGILWKRLSIKMALQVDSATSTYQVRGLPKEPITNPGIESLEAALHPTKNDYLYFLSDLSGKFYYAKDFEGHQKNRELYLNR